MPYGLSNLGTIPPDNVVLLQFLEVIFVNDAPGLDVSVHYIADALHRYSEQCVAVEFHMTFCFTPPSGSRSPDRVQYRFIIILMLPEVLTSYLLPVSKLFHDAGIPFVT